MSLFGTVLDIARFSLGAVKPLGGPLKVQIEITHRCNSRCQSCAFWRHRAMDEMKAGDWQRVLLDIKSIGTRRVAFGGGEPTLFPDIFDLIRYAKAIGLRVSLGTNGLLLSECHRQIAESGLDIIEISLDGPPGIHNENRGISDAFQKTMAGVEALIRHPFRPLIQYNFTPNKINVTHLGSFVETALAHHADMISIEPAHLLNDQLHLCRELFVPEAAIRVFEDQMRKVLNRYSHLLSPPIEYYQWIPDFFRDPLEVSFSRRFRCVSGYGMLVLDPGGNVFGCPAKEKSLGNVNRVPLRKLWRSEEHIQDIKRVKSGRHQPCWLNSVSPMNMVFDMVKRPNRWGQLYEIAKREMRKRI